MISGFSGLRDFCMSFYSSNHIFGFLSAFYERRGGGGEIMWMWVTS